MDLTGIYKIIFYFFYLEAIGVGFFVKHWKSLDYLWGFRWIEFGWFNDLYKIIL